MRARVFSWHTRTSRLTGQGQGKKFLFCWSSGPTCQPTQAHATGAAAALIALGGWCPVWAHGCVGAWDAWAAHGVHRWMVHKIVPDVHRSMGSCFYMLVSTIIADLAIEGANGV